ncbi:hypothetical protein lotta81_gp040 [Flavobacterium phage vB_FspM_lotta8-1]|uniref:Tape measure protein N-terminal domain-containing protein n=2 Tax=Pippivirus lotta TaxID=2844291 RepID=A0A6B9LF71_9CAUD|nr:hypothetical protein HWC85_gp40 [Flavobacterium phage vB_FspM_lotta8-1]QHB38498.1 hypothetical protein lotta81_gp040 [Flavobacterium phage vB_FspM_lotta8-1]QHB38551.1 hypothetical protein lotta82_gp040 [Flavobacterium phage vB_FspM_lotta8-2]
MAENTETYVIKLKDVNFLAGMKAAEDAAGKVEKKTNAVGSAMSMIGGVVAGISVVSLGTQIIDTLAKFEKFEAVLTTTLGTESAAQDAMAQITEFAAKTPFEVDGLTDSFVRLANQGFVPTMDEMTKLGDLASSKGKDMTQLSEALIDAQVGEFERLKEFGIRASKAGDQVSFTFKGQTKTMKMSDDAVKDYVLSLGDLAGVQGSMAGISKTTGGQISNLSDTVTSLYLKLGTKLKPAISSVIGGLMNAVAGISSFADWVTSGTVGAKAFGVAMAVIGGGLVTYGLITGALAIKTGILTAYQWLLNAAMTANPIGIVVVAIGALIAGVVMAYQKFDTFRAIVNGSWAVLKQVGSNIMGMFSKIPEMVIKAFTQIPLAIKSVFSGVGDLFNAIFGDGKLSDVPKILKGIGTGILKSNPITGLAANVAEEATKGVGDAFGGAYNDTMNQAKKDKAAAGKGQGKKAGDSTLPTAGAGAGAKDKGLKAGISEVRSTAPKNFYINIGKLVEELNINTTNLTEGSAKIKEELTKVLLTAVNDMQIISE